MTIEEKFGTYLQLSKEAQQLKKQVKDITKKIEGLEKEIKEYMETNEMDSISVPEGEIILYEKKVPQTFKKENIVERLNEKLHDNQKAEELTECILTNKSYALHNKLRAVTRK